MRVLVIGSAGFIGSNLMRLLGPDGVPFDLRHGQDARRPAEVTAALGGVQRVVHLAANGGVPDSVRAPMASLQDVAAVLTVLECCRKVGVPMLAASTAGALAGAPRSPYAAGKQAVEGYCSAYSISFGLPTTVVRLANVYGPSCGGKRTLVAAAMRAALRGDPFDLYGDGTQERDFVYVGDICAGILALIEGRLSGLYSLGSGRLTSVNQMLREIEAVSGRTVPVRRRPGRAGESAGVATVPLRQLLPAPTALQQGLQQTWDWFQSECRTVTVCT